MRIWGSGVRKRLSGTWMFAKTLKAARESFKRVRKHQIVSRFVDTDGKVQQSFLELKNSPFPPSDTSVALQLLQLPQEPLRPHR